MKYARTIILDKSDIKIFEKVARAGEWAISGTFEFSDHLEIQNMSMKKSAFCNGWLGLSTLGRATLVAVTSVLENEIDHLIQGLAEKFMTYYGAPSMDMALQVAKEEIEFMLTICQRYPENTILMINREFTGEGIKEKVKHIKSPNAELKTFAILK